MKSLILIFISLYFIFACSSQKRDSLLYIYTNNDSLLFFEKLDYKSGKIQSSMNIASFDIFNLNMKNDFLILNKYQDILQKTLIFRNGKIYRKLDIDITDFQLSSVHSKNVLVLDSTDLMKLDGSYKNTFLVYLKDEHKPSKITIADKKIDSDIDNTLFRYLYYPYSFPQSPSATKWVYKLQIFDLKKNRVINFDSIQQTNHNIAEGRWEFLPNYSYWVTDNKLTYLFYTIVQDKINVRIKSYQIDTDKLEVLKEFCIPNNFHTINMKYIVKGESVFLSNGNVIYEVNDANEVTVLYRSEKRLISGFYF